MPELRPPRPDQRRVTGFRLEPGREVRHPTADEGPRLRDSAINLRTPKRMGRLLDGAGRATGTVIRPTALAAY